MAVSPLQPGLEEAIARMQLTRERLAAKRGIRPIVPNMARAVALPLPARPVAPSKPGPERLNRPVQVGRVIRVWWNWD